MSPKPKYSEFLSIDNEQLKSLRDIAVESIREAIIGGLFKPGEHLKERELSQAMGISTTPIKEAFRILGHEGLVVTVPRKGTYVSEVVQSSMEEILMIKANLEGLCARLAAMKITDAELQALTATLRRMEESEGQGRRSAGQGQHRVSRADLESGPQSHAAQHAFQYLRLRQGVPQAGAAAECGNARRLQRAPGNFQGHPEKGPGRRGRKDESPHPENGAQRPAFLRCRKECTQGIHKTGKGE